MNIYMATPNMSRLHKSHFYAWKNGLKTGMYYLIANQQQIQFNLLLVIIVKVAWLIYFIKYNN